MKIYRRCVCMSEISIESDDYEAMAADVKDWAATHTCTRNDLRERDQTGTSGVSLGFTSLPDYNVHMDVTA